METNNSRRPSSGRRPYSGSGGAKPAGRPSFSRGGNGGGGDRRSSGTRRPSSSARHSGGGRSSGGSRGGSRGGGRKQPTFDPSQFINKNPAQVETEVYVPKHTFKDFKLGGLIVANVEKLGIETPSPISTMKRRHELKLKSSINSANFSIVR